jgi:hypothetical protein
MDVKAKLKDLESFWHQLQDQCEDRQLRLDNVLGFQQKYQDALENISSWLDVAEQKLFSSDAHFDPGDMVKDNEVRASLLRGDFFLQEFSISSRKYCSDCNVYFFKISF